MEEQGALLCCSKFYCCLIGIAICLVVPVILSGSIWDYRLRNLPIMSRVWMWKKDDV